MPANNNSRWGKRLISLAVLLMLVAVRLNESRWFPEKLIDFFGKDLYPDNPLPALGFTDYFSLLLRYLTNSILSIVFLHVWFGNERITRFLIKFFAATGMVLLLLFGIAVYTYQPGQYLFLFYIRRLIIQPVWLFILFPVIYYLENRKNGR